MGITHCETCGGAVGGNCGKLQEDLRKTLGEPWLNLGGSLSNLENLGRTFGCMLLVHAPLVGNGGDEKGSDVMGRGSTGEPNEQGKGFTHPNS